MKQFLGALAVILGPLWMFQLRANCSELLWPFPYTPDFVGLACAFAAMYGQPFWAVAFAACSGLIEDVSVAQRLGVFAGRDALLVCLFAPARKVFDFRSPGPVFCVLLIFLLIQKLTTALFFTPHLKLADCPHWGPQLLAVCAVTAFVGCILRSSFESLFADDERRKERRRL